MFQAITEADAFANNCVTEYPSGSVAVDLVGRRDTEGDSPLAYMVRALPGSELAPHFHPVDQFQVFVEGTPTLGRHAMRLGSVHYADPFTPYGPITAPEATGYAYLTLRPRSAMDTHWIPAEIALAKGKRGENIQGETAEPEAREPGLHELFSRPDGVSASEFVALPGASLPPLTGRGYYVVLAGEVICEGKTFPAKSCFWTTGEDQPELTAGQDGATLVLLTFGSEAAEV